EQGQLRRPGADPGEVDTDIDDVHATGEAAARLEEQPRLERGEAHSLLRAYRDAAHLARGAVDPRWDVDRQRRDPGLGERGGDDGRVTFELTPKARTEHPVDREVGSGERAAQSRRGHTFGEHELVDADASRPQVTR